MNCIRSLTLLGIACVLAGPACAQEASTAGVSANELVGLWGAEHSFGPEIQGRLIVRQDGERWRAEIQGHAAPVHEQDGLLSFELPGGRGSFLGRIDGNALRGHWTQPPGRIESYAFATPVVLAPAGPGIWQGHVDPFDDRFSLYVEFWRDDDDQIRARMRNPERNIGVFYDLGRVEVDGRDLHLFDYDGVETLLTGRLSEDGDRWTLDLANRNATFEFTRRGRDQAAGYYPRDSSDSTYQYRAPLEDVDGWATAHANDVGMDIRPLEELVQSILATEYEKRSTPYVQAVLVARNGVLVLDEYFHGFHADRTHDTRSSAKSLTALLVGIAMDHVAPLAIDTPVVDVFASQYELTHVDPRKRAVTIEHLLTMRSGLDCDDDDSESPGNEDRMQTQDVQPDWIRYTLDLPMTREPGEQAIYCTAGINLLGGVIEQSTGMTMPEFVDAHYATPLDIRDYHLNLTPSGRAYMGGGIRFRPRDHLKLGQLIVDDGRWRDRQVVSPSWIERVGAPHASIHETDDYGYGFWRTTLTVDGRDYPVVYASGNGGQLVIAIPSLELVVLFAGGNYMDYRTWSAFLHDLVPRYIIPAIRSR